VDADTRDLLRGSIHELLECHNGDLVARLDELGWQDVLFDDRPAAVDLLFTEQGRAGQASAALDSVLLDTAGGHLHETDIGELAVIHPFGAATSVNRDGKLLIDGVLLSDPRTTGGGVVVADDSESTAYLITGERAMTAATPVGGFDPASSLYMVHLDVAIDDTRRGACDWAGAAAAGRRALASELVGNGSAMLDIAVAHVRQRRQFGRPIGANQVPRHLLADCYTRLAAARELIDVSWKSGTPWDARVAKTYAGQASDTVSRACLQVCGAMGLTTEHPLGGYVKRARILDSLYGGWRRAVHDIGITLLRSESVPTGPRV
jgi:Acyl-CoA dehydrogenase, C-terminal domain